MNLYDPNAFVQPMGLNDFRGGMDFTSLVPQDSAVLNGVPKTDWWSRDALFGEAGWAKPALGIANSLMGAYLGMQQYGLAKKTLAENKRQFNLNFDAQRSTVNSQLADRQRARVASNPTAYQSVSDYMGQYGIKG